MPTLPLLLLPPRAAPADECSRPAQATGPATPAEEIRRERWRRRSGTGWCIHSFIHSFINSFLVMFSGRAAFASLLAHVVTRRQRAPHRSAVIASDGRASCSLLTPAGALGPRRHLADKQWTRRPVTSCCRRGDQPAPPSRQWNRGDDRPPCSAPNAARHASAGVRFSFSSHAHTHIDPRYVHNNPG